MEKNSSINFHVNQKEFSWIFFYEKKLCMHYFRCTSNTPGCLKEKNCLVWMETCVRKGFIARYMEKKRWKSFHGYIAAAKKYFSTAWVSAVNLPSEILPQTHRCRHAPPRRSKGIPEGSLDFLGVIGSECCRAFHLCLLDNVWAALIEIPLLMPRLITPSSSSSSKIEPFLSVAPCISRFYGRPETFGERGREDYGAWENCRSLPIDLLLLRVQGSKGREGRVLVRQDRPDEIQVRLCSQTCFCRLCACASDHELPMMFVFWVSLCFQSSSNTAMPINERVSRFSL